MTTKRQVKALRTSEYLDKAASGAVGPEAIQRAQREAMHLAAEQKRVRQNFTSRRWRRETTIWRRVNDFAVEFGSQVYVVMQHHDCQEYQVYTTQPGKDWPPTLAWMTEHHFPPPLVRSPEIMEPVELRSTDTIMPYDPDNNVDSSSGDLAGPDEDIRPDLIPAQVDAHRPTKGPRPAALQLPQPTVSGQKEMLVHHHGLVTPVQSQFNPPSGQLFHGTADPASPRYPPEEGQAVSGHAEPAATAGLHTVIRHGDFFGSSDEIDRSAEQVYDHAHRVPAAPVWQRGDTPYADHIPFDTRRFLPAGDSPKPSPRSDRPREGRVEKTPGRGRGRGRGRGALRGAAPLQRRSSG